MPAAAAVDITYSPDDVQLRGPVPPPHTGFGDAVDALDVNGDGCADVVVGQPGTSTGHGVVSIYDGPVGLDAQPVATFSAPDAVDGDRFGAAVALSGYDPNLVHASDLWIGAPGHAVGGRANAGVLYHYRFTASGTAQLVQEMSEARNDIPGAADTGDRFGAALSAGGQIVGIPGADVGAARQAGAVATFGSTLVALSPLGYYTQDSPGIPGTAESGDNFGAAVAMSIFYCPQEGGYAVGAPGEDLGSATNAGSVTLITEPDGPGPPPCPARLLYQGGGLPGTLQANADVGAALGIEPAVAFQDEDTATILQIGAPGEDVFGQDAAGVEFTRNLHGSVHVQLGTAGPLAGQRFAGVYPPS